jgi:cyclic beta-1,2-glucan synthetase
MISLLAATPQSLTKACASGGSMPKLEQPIRGELLGIERLEQQAEELARTHRQGHGPVKGRSLTPRVRDNARVLLSCYRTIAQASREERNTTPAAEWLVDNYHLADEQLREILDEPPRAYYGRLPKLGSGRLAGFPRILGVTWFYLEHQDSRLDPELFRRFLRAYQRVEPLTIGELWGVAMASRFVLIENLRRMAEWLVSIREARRQADQLADALLEQDSGQPADVPGRNAYGRDCLPTAFAAQLVLRLRDQDPSLSAAYHWLQKLLASQGLGAEEAVRSEHQRQAALTVSISNVITSLRSMASLDWTGLFESVSLVDELLRPETNFGLMDLASRDRYRDALEELAAGSGHTEPDVAKALLARVGRERTSGTSVDPRQADPGYYLIAGGRPEFEKQLGFRPSLGARLARPCRGLILPAYVGAIALAAGLLLAGPAWLTLQQGAGLAAVIALALLALVPATDAAVALVNRAAMWLVEPGQLPRMELAKGIPREHRTMVVVPAMLGSEAEVDELLRNLEVHYLANQEEELSFALLSDWRDSPTETSPSDVALLSAAEAGLRRMNERHGPGPEGQNRFFLLHRRRTWCETEQKWMGWERKRGKLKELGALLRGGVKTTFVLRNGKPPAVPANVRFVVTLDADTRLQKDSVRRLVGAMAHPLNRPRLDPRTQCVVEGHAILQPRVTPMLAAAHEDTLYHRVSCGLCGIDAYASTVSDVYQDLFGQGSFVGKGIYDVDAFEAALDERVPEGAMLSHDLFEGVFARAGLLTSDELFDEAPTHYQVAAARQHRWVRGDWQLLPWLFGRYSQADDAPERLTIPALGRWKMLDNLRRSLSAPSMFAMLMTAWLLHVSGASVAWLWSGFALVTAGVPAFLPVVTNLLPRRQRISKLGHFRDLGFDAVVALSQVAMAMTFVAHQAWLMGDAIGRTLWRMTVSRRNLLEWVTATHTKSASSLEPGAFVVNMRSALALGALAGTAVFVLHPAAWVAAAPIVALWLLSPLVAWRVSLPLSKAQPGPLSERDRRVLRRAARQIWRFFATFVGPEDHGLPPDNFQEEPTPVIAHRTSPTNIGLYLLSTVTARQFGWIGLLETIERLEKTLESIGKLEHFRGHLLNWYETRELRALEPRYVSTVDSGNLAGHLLTVSRACLELAGRPLFGPAVLAGTEDTLDLVRELAHQLPAEVRTQIVKPAHLEEEIEALSNELKLVPATLADWPRRLEALRLRSDTLVDLARAFAQEHARGDQNELVSWSERVRAALRGHLRDAALMTPWVARANGSPLPAGLAEALGEACVPLSTLPEVCADAAREASALAAKLASDSPDRSDETSRLQGLAASLLQASEDCRLVVARLDALANRASEMFHEMDFSFLFDRQRKLFSIGYRVEASSLDPSHYDMLASEARLATFLAIAKGDIPAASWFHLSRALTPIGRGFALISWSGSMFEYLMPALVMPTPTGSLLHETYRTVVNWQMEYARKRGIPWGVSESAYYLRDVHMTYQYSSFGVPGLGLKRGLSDDLVITPYATALAAMVNGAAAARNLEALDKLGARGPYGYYEALDFTAARLPEGQRLAVVKAYFAHHQGMALVSLANVLEDGCIQKLFNASPSVQAVDLLLQERPPRHVAVARPRAEEVGRGLTERPCLPSTVRCFSSANQDVAVAHLLSNGRYSVLLTTAGSGYSHFQNMAVTRWREDSTRDCWGSYLFIRDVNSGAVWSAGYQPAGVAAQGYEVFFSEHMAEFRRRDGTISSSLEVVVSPEEDAELRRVTLTNSGDEVRELDLTTYQEMVLAPREADQSHLAFSKLFVETEWVAAEGALLASRRPRSAEDKPIWAAHLMAVEGEMSGEVEYETDRARFLGRGRELRRAISVLDGRPLSQTVGRVLDPILSLRQRVKVAPGATVRLTFAMLIVSSREAALELAGKYREPAAFDRAVTLAWTQAQVQLHHTDIRPEEAKLFQSLTGALLYSDPSMRPSGEILKRNQRGQSGLWPHGISGDLPIVLVTVEETGERDLVRQLLKAHEYWQAKGLETDLVILNEEPVSYLSNTQSALEGMVRAGRANVRTGVGGVRGNIFLVRGGAPSEGLPPEARELLMSAARIVLHSRNGTLAEQLGRPRRPARVGLAKTRRQAIPEPASRPARLASDLEFYNGLGGFSAGGREYVIALADGQWTPMPWLNVVANPSFGFQVSESGAGYTWSGNSRERQLTRWSNDPVSDPPGEALYVMDRETGEFWSPTALPIRERGGLYVARHGPGYSRFERTSHGLALTLTVFVLADAPVKVSRLQLENRSGLARRLSVTAYVEWLLGAPVKAARQLVVTSVDPATGALFARNPWAGEFAERVAFADLNGRQTALTADRSEFIGRHGTLENPAALEPRVRLSGKVGAGLDPCAALSASLELAPGATTELTFFLGEGANEEAARELVRWARSTAPEQALQAAIDGWDQLLGAVQVKTPEPSMDLLLNRWLLYQTVACRLWARSAFYQAGGAYGFRDQLQDCMALTVASAGLAREHLLKAAAHQFKEGDVQHWWHPPSGRGVRTRVSDDLLWLPYAVAHYAEVTGDRSVLDETAPFLEGPALDPGQHESYFKPAVSRETGSLFEHCARAIDRSLAVGRNGLPLIGTGDWNDGLNRVGPQGQGESVWLGWFLLDTIEKFAAVAEGMGRAERAVPWRQHVPGLKTALEAAWDGGWYRRAYFDDGTPLGSAANAECQIDSLSQSWAVLSGAAEPARALLAMQAVDEHLVMAEEGIVRLFTPAFDTMPLDPGYIKGYLPGIRENGGQYTHAAAWVIIANALLGNGNRAGELFRMLNPILHADSRSAVARYMVEPYVVAADVYAERPHVGRGGWTWYTGSAGWLYRAGLEWILGVRLSGSRLHVNPCLPATWRHFDVSLRYHSSRYEIAVENPAGVERGVARVELDGVTLPGTLPVVELVQDGQVHRVRVVMG